MFLCRGVDPRGRGRHEMQISGCRLPVSYFSVSTKLWSGGDFPALPSSVEMGEVARIGLRLQCEKTWKMLGRNVQG